MGPRGSLYPRPQARGDSRIDVAVLPRKMVSLKHKVAGPDSGDQQVAEFPCHKTKQNGTAVPLGYFRRVQHFVK